MATPYRCTLCLQVGKVTNKNSEANMRDHLGAPSIHNMGQYACQFPGCGRYSYRVDRNENHNDDPAVADHQAVWVIDPVRLAALDRAVAACRLPHAVVAPTVAGPGPGAPPAAGLAAHATAALPGPPIAGSAAPVAGHVAPTAGHAASTAAVLPGPPVTAQATTAAPSATQVAPVAPVVPTPGPTAPTAPTPAGAQGQNNPPGAGQAQVFPDSTEFTLFRDLFEALMADRERERYRNGEQ